jgi:hypothetical protein
VIGSSIVFRAMCADSEQPVVARRRALRAFRTGGQHPFLVLPDDRGSDAGAAGGSDASPDTEHESEHDPGAGGSSI